MQRFNPTTSNNTKIKYRYQTNTQGNTATYTPFDKYCSVCGSKMQKVNGQYRCLNCNEMWTYPMNMMDSEA